jgi:hypothetical protein
MRSTPRPIPTRLASQVACDGSQTKYKPAPATTIDTKPIAGAREYSVQA